MEPSLRHRINAGRVAIRNQISFFRAQFGGVQSTWKEDDTRVTFADFAISEKILRELESSFPNDALCSEESHPGDEVVSLEHCYAWILDPIDGTNNYAIGMPYCGISLGLLKNGIPVYGFIYDFSRDRLIEGGKTFGLQVNGKKFVRPSRPFEVRSSIIALHFPLSPLLTEKLNSILQTYRVRSLGSAALNLSYLALGTLDGVLDQKVKIWDIAAGISLLGGAGLDFSWFEEDPFPLNAFHVNAPSLPFYAGSLGFHQEIGPLFS